MYGPVSLLNIQVLALTCHRPGLERHSVIAISGQITAKIKVSILNHIRLFYFE